MKSPPRSYEIAAFLMLIGLVVSKNLKIHLFFVFCRGIYHSEAWKPRKKSGKLRHETLIRVSWVLLQTTSTFGLVTSQTERRSWPYHNSSRMIMTFTDSLSDVSYFINHSLKPCISKRTLFNLFGVKEETYL